MIFPHLFQVHAGLPEYENDYKCFDVRFTTVAWTDQTIYTDSDTITGFIYAFKDYTYWPNGKQPNCLGLDETSGRTTPWSNPKLHFKETGQ